MIKDKAFLEKDEFDKRVQLALAWLKRSFDVTGRQGSSSYYSRLYKPIAGWAPAYPETTGYIIETLFDYERLFPKLGLRQYAVEATDWITTLPLEGGALPGGFVNSKEPSIFNTGQMIFGLVRAFEETGNQAYYDTFKNAVNWLLSVLEPDGSWQVGAYVKGYVPAYYTRVVWSVLYANRHLNDANVYDRMVQAIGYYQKRINKNMTVTDWGFRVGQKAFTHTIAYTIRGFLESGYLLGDKQLGNISIDFGEKIIKLRELKGKLAGWYDDNWKGDNWFTCLTGNFQISIILMKLYQKTGDIRYFNTALKIFDDAYKNQNLKTGAIPGSKPIYGRYLIFRYPNWATKFYLDAYLLLKQEADKLEAQLAVGN